MTGLACASFRTMTPELLRNIPGGPELLAWFDGHAPSFHDAEVLSMHFDRDGPSCAIAVHTFRMTEQVDAEGYFICDLHVVVRFLLTELLVTRMENFSHQNAIYGLSISRGLDAGYVLEFDEANGVEGTLEGRSLTITLEPGVPTGSMYSEKAVRPDPSATQSRAQAEPS